MHACCVRLRGAGARIGVGGEYPMAAGSAAERAEAGGKNMAKHRGREVLTSAGPVLLLFARKPRDGCTQKFLRMSSACACAAGGPDLLHAGRRQLRQCARLCFLFDNKRGVWPKRSRWAVDNPDPCMERPGRWLCCAFCSPSSARSSPTGTASTATSSTCTTQRGTFCTLQTPLHTSWRCAYASCGRAGPRTNVEPAGACDEQCMPA